LRSYYKKQLDEAKKGDDEIMSEKYAVSEFVNFEFDEEGGDFRITIVGPKKYEYLILEKINEITITDDDLKDYETSEET